MASLRAFFMNQVCGACTVLSDVLSRQERDTSKSVCNMRLSLSWCRNGRFMLSPLQLLHSAPSYPAAAMSKRAAPSATSHSCQDRDRVVHGISELFVPRRLDPGKSRTTFSFLVSSISTSKCPPFLLPVHRSITCPSPHHRSQTSHLVQSITPSTEERCTYFSRWGVDSQAHG